MRIGEALRGLTTRGRAFLAAGVAAIVSAVILGQSDLVRVGVLMVALPLATVALASRSRYRISLRRTIDSPVVEVGTPAEVTLHLHNQGTAPGSILFLEDRLPFALGSRPRFILDGIIRDWRGQLSYPVRSDVRGRFPIGPVTVLTSDPFGLVGIGRSFSSTATLTVTPKVVDLAPTGIGGAWVGAGHDRPRSFAAGTPEDVTVREYRRGDDLRRVHWRSSARVGELMVRREEQPWQSRATVLVDTRASSHRGQGAASSLEVALSAAASVVAHLGRLGFTVRLVTGSDEEEHAAWHDREAALNTSAMLERLAVVEPSGAVGLDAGQVSDAGGEGLLVAVLGSQSDTDVATLRRLVRGSSAAVALVVAADQWAGGSGESAAQTVHRLRAQGWRAAAVTPFVPVDAAWQQLGRSRVSARGGAVGAQR